MSFSLRLNSEPEIERSIRDAWRMGLLAAAISFTLTLIYASGPGFAHVAIWAWLDVLLLVGLSFGVRAGYRSSAVLLFVYYLVSKLFFWVGESAFIGVPLALFFAYYFWKGIQGTYSLQR